LVSLARVGAEFKESDADNVQSELLKSIIASLPSIYAPSKRFLEVFNIKEARAGNDADMWLDHELYPDIRDAKDVSSRL
jgi:DNA mismatch repair protein MSH3